MKKMVPFLITALMLIISASVSAQSGYPHKSIYEIQYRPDDSLAAGKDRSSFTPWSALTSGAATTIGKDTIEIVGVVMVPPRLPDGRRTFGTSLLNSSNSAATVFTVVDTAALRTNDFKFQYIFVNNVDSSVSNKLGTGTLQKGDVVRLLGRVEENTNMTKFKLLDNRKIDGNTTFSGIAEVIDHLDEEQLPKPVELQVTAFNTGKWVSTDLSTKNLIVGEYYEAASIKMKGLKVGNIIKTNGETEVIVTDNSNNEFTIDNYSTFFGFPSNKPFAPKNSIIDSVIGVVGMFNTTSSKPGMWTINPITTADIHVAANILPNVNSYSKDKIYYAANENINLTYFISDADGTVDTAWVYYRINESGNFTKLQLTKNANDFTGTIPALGIDSALVEIYVIAKDNQAGLGRSPISKYDGIWVLNHEPSIQTVQYSTNSLGSSFFVGDSLTLTGVVTSTLKDMGEIHIQNGTGPWSGILVYSPSKLDTFRLGDKIRIRGKITEFSDKTEITYPNPSKMEILETHNDYQARLAAVPAASLVSTNDIKVGAALTEAYEAVFVKMENVFVVGTDVEVDFNTGKSRGEIFVSENNTATDGLRVDDIANLRNHKLPYLNTLFVDYTLNAYDSTKSLYVKGQKFDVLRGIMDYRNFVAKLSPRDSTDFGFTMTPTSVRADKPVSIQLNQNYPNPFNPSTTISFSLTGSNRVSLEVYNIIGQKIATLVNNQVLSAQTYSYNFNAAKLSSGLYFYKLIVDSKVVQTRKMMLVK